MGVVDVFLACLKYYEGQCKTGKVSFQEILRKCIAEARRAELRITLFRTIGLLLMKHRIRNSLHILADDSLGYGVCVYGVCDEKCMAFMDEAGELIENLPGVLAAVVKVSEGRICVEPLMWRDARLAVM